MKKILTLIAAVACFASASAQVIMSNDFEDGTAGTWNMWEKKEVKIVGADQAKDSKHAVDFFTGGYCDVKGVKEGLTYKASADVCCKWGEDGGTLMIQGYDPKAKKLVTIKEVSLPTSREYKSVSITFKAKFGGYHRLSYSPSQGNQCKYVVDNLKVEVASGKK